MHRLTAIDTPMVRYTRTIFRHTQNRNESCDYINISFINIMKTEILKHQFKNSF